MKVSSKFLITLAFVVISAINFPASSQAEEPESVGCDTCQHGRRAANVMCIRFFYKHDGQHTAIIFSGDRTKCVVAENVNCLGETACQ